MAIPTNIKTLLSGSVVEWEKIEFKETWDGAVSLETYAAIEEALSNAVYRRAYDEREPIEVRVENERKRNY